MQRFSELMTRDVRTLAAADSVVQTARTLQTLAVGAIPVCGNGKLVGMVTERDLVLRAVAQDRAPDATPLSAVMSGDTAWCYEDQPAAEAAAQMRQRQLRRMPVVDRDRRLVGIVSPGDLATKANEEAAAGDALADVSTPSRPVG